MDEQNSVELPVEVWFAEDETPQHALCWRSNVRCRTFYGTGPHGLGLSRAALPPIGFAFCVYAIVLSRFEQVLFLDVDAAPIRDVVSLFESRKFQLTGQLFWADFWGSNTTDAGESAHAASPLWDFVHVKPYPTRELESSVLVVDKRRHWRACNLVLHLARHGQLMALRPPRGYPKVVHGDKDLWRVAFLYLRLQMFIAQPVMLGYRKFGLVFRRQSFGHFGTDRLTEVHFVHQPPIAAIPRWNALDTALTETHCRDRSRQYFTWGGPNFWDYSPCLIRYDAATGKLQDGHLGFWLMHSCEQGAGLDATVRCEARRV